MKSRHEAQRLRLQRRTFLKAIGLGIGAPLAFKMSKLAVAAPEGPPTRLFIFYLPHGAPTEHFETGDTLAFPGPGVGMLEPFAPYQDYFTLLRGVTMNEGADNHAAIRTVLTGVAGDDGGDSIDYTIAQQLGTTAHVLGVQPYRAGGALDHDSRLVQHGSWVTPIVNPADAVDDLFAGLGTGAATPTPVVDDNTFRNEALTLTEGEVEAMQKQLSGLTSETNKLQLHLDAIRNLKNRGGGGIGVLGCDTRPSMPSVEAMIGQDPWAHANFATVLDGHLEMSANALACGTARIITLQTMFANAQITMDFPGGPNFAKNHHDPLSHSADAAGRTEFAHVQKWFYSRLCDKFLSVLAATDDPADPGKKVLDNTVVLVCSEINDGMLHKGWTEDLWLDGKSMKSHLPWMLIGKGGGFLKSGQRAMTEVMNTDILATVAGAMGVTLQTIGSTNVSVPGVLKA
jgi:hypothetical protein